MIWYFGLLNIFSLTLFLFLTHILGVVSEWLFGADRNSDIYSNFEFQISPPVRILKRNNNHRFMDGDDGRSWALKKFVH